MKIQEQIKLINDIQIQIIKMERYISNKLEINFLFHWIRQKLNNLKKILDKKDKRLILIKFIELDKEIYKMERNMRFQKYNNWWIIYFEELRNIILDVYLSIFDDDNKEYPIIEFIQWIIDDEMGFYDIDLVPDEIRNKYKVNLKWNISMNNKNNIEINDLDEEKVVSYILSSWMKEEYPDANIKFKDLNEILNFIEKKWYYNF